MGGFEGILGIASSAMTAFGGGDGAQIDFNADAYADRANKILDAALKKALPYSENFSEYAAQQVRRAEEEAKNQLQSYYEQGQALGAPYREAGYRALDQYQDTLGMARPGVPSSQIAKAAEAKAKEDAAMRGSATAMAQFADRLDIDPQTRQGLINTAMVSRNPMGLTQGLQDFLGRNPNVDPRMRAQQAAQASQGSDPYPHEYMYRPTRSGIGGQSPAPAQEAPLPSDRMMNPALRNLIPQLASTSMQKNIARYNLPPQLRGLLG